MATTASATLAFNLVSGGCRGQSLLTLIKTEKSFLNFYTGEEYKDLILLCIKEIKDELESDKPLQMYGKTVYQHTGYIVIHFI